MAETTDELTYISFPITKFEKDGDGDLIVTGKATDGSVDSDDQIVDSEWSAKALTDWHASGGNVRVQHQARRDPAGKSLSIEIDRDGDGGHWVKSLVVEPVAKRLVEKGVLAAYSVGIARPVIKRDPTGKARGGIVAGGELAEISLVDRPANKNCGLVLAKSETAGEPMELEQELFGIDKAAEAELLTKGAAPGASDPGAPSGGDAASSAPSDDPDATDDDEDDGNDNGEGDATDDTDSDGVSKDLGTPDLIATADEQTRAAYKTERTEWLAREPGVRNALSGTEYLAKRAEWMRWNTEGDEAGLTGTRDGAERWLSKRDFTQAERDQAADSGAAMDDGSFPIKNGEDLGNAIHLAGHAKDPGKARAHIKRRAAALGMSGKIPDSWKTSEPDPDGTLEDVLAKHAIPVDTARLLLGYTPMTAEKKAAPDGTVGDSPSSTFNQGGKGQQCPTCKGDGKIMDDKRTCPDCKGSGKMTAKAPAEPETVKAGSKSCTNCGKNYHSDTKIKRCESCGTKLPKAAAKTAKPGAPAPDPAVKAALDALQDTIAKALAAGLITGPDAQALMAEAADKAARPLPADTRPAGTHREPDGTTTVEQLEPQAGLGTDPDPVPDKVPASVKAQDAPYGVTRMHDTFCAAYDLGDVQELYPAVKTVTDAVDEAWFTAQVAAAAAAGKAKKTIRLSGLLEAAQAVKGMDPAAVTDGREHLRKSFTDMYPDQHITPKDAPKPGQFQRPYIAAGHANQGGTDPGPAHIPNSAHTPAPGDFTRGPLTAGHAAPSPANKDDRPPASSNGARTYYTTASRDAARTALQAMHDHIAGAFPDLCPMATSKSVLPPDMGARNVPHPVHPAPAQSGVDVGKAMGSINDARAALGLDAWTPPAAAPGADEKTIAKAVRKALAATRPGLDAAQLRELLTEQITPLTERYETEIGQLRKELDELGARPDPAMAPVRGAVAKADGAPPVPVERRSLVDEAAKVRDHAAAEEANYRAYIEMRARSTDPGTREKALTVLDTLNKAAGLPPAQ